MTLSLLLDLDDTLLDTNVEQFIPAYFRALSKHLAARVEPDKMLAALSAGTRRMMLNQDPSRTLGQVFDAEYYPALGLDKESLNDLIDEFYDNVFPELGALMQPRPAARSLVDWAFAQGYRVAIATDPLFPIKAMHHRLRFAGLPPEKYPFDLVSSFETFHFTKSHPAYFAEVLGRLGWPEGPVLMVGNDADRDLAPARALGLPTFWVRDDAPQASDPQATGRGGLSDLRPWIEQINLADLEPQFTSKEAFQALLTAAPAVIQTLVMGLEPADWTRRPGAGEWALTEVLCHLRDSEREVHRPRLERMRAEEQPFLAATNSDVWAGERGYLAQDGRSAARDFLAARMSLLHELNQLTDADWERKARHSIFGPTTLREIVGFMAEHDRLHIQQIWKILHPPAR